MTLALASTRWESCALRHCQNPANSKQEHQLSGTGPCQSPGHQVSKPGPPLWSMPSSDWRSTEKHGCQLQQHDPAIPSTGFPLDLADAWWTCESLQVHWFCQFGSNSCSRDWKEARSFPPREFLRQLSLLPSLGRLSLVSLGKRSRWQRQNSSWNRYL